MEFTKAAELLDARTLARYGRKRLENNTYLYQRDEDTYAVRLHNTDVVLIHRDGSYTLNSGGWYSNTTKDRINKYSPAHVYQKDYTWYIIPATNPLLQEGETAQRHPRYYDRIKVDNMGDII